jgi:hypothetical protein
MIRSLLIGFWACLVTVCAGMAMSHFRQARAMQPAEHAAAAETRATREINVPRIKNGAVKGYVVAKLNYVVDMQVAKTLPIAPDAIVLDETFRYIYEDDSIDFDHLDRVNLGTMTKALVKSVNTRMKGDVIMDFGVQEFTFMPSSDTRRR